MISVRIFFGILLILFFGSFFLVRYSNRLRIIEKSILIIFATYFIALFCYPELINIPMNRLGIENQIEIFFYTYIFLSSWVFIKCHLRLNRLNSKLNTVISELALLKVERGNKDNNNI